MVSLSHKISDFILLYNYTTTAGVLCISFIDKNETLLTMVVYYRLHAFMYTFNYDTSLLSRYKKKSL